MSERYIAVGRSGHRLVALPRSSTRARGSSRSARSSTTTSSRAPASSSTTRRRSGATSSTSSPTRWRRAALRARPRRARHHQPARDDRAVGPRDRRTGAQRAQLAGHAHRPPRARARRRRGADRFRDRCGLPLATYFSGPKIRWLLDHVDGLRERAEAGEVLFGTMDSWLIWNLTGRHSHRRHERRADDADEPRDARLGRRPARRDGRAAGDAARDPAVDGGLRRGGGALAGLPVAAALGDQHAALFGQTCFAPATPSARTAPAASC